MSRLSGAKKREYLIKRSKNQNLKRKQGELFKMAFKMKASAEKLEGIQPVPQGIYKVLFLSFTPKKSKNPNAATGVYSVNLNAKVKILDHPEFENDRFVFASLNSGIEAWWQDFVHSFGLEMEDQLGPEPSIPGVFDADKAKFNADDPETWVYQGPLTGKTAMWELGIGEYQGRPQQTIVRFVCSVKDCATRFPKISHSKDMAKKS